MQGQKFLCYSADLKSISEVNAAYAKIWAKHLSARHVICAYRLPFKNFAINEDFWEDDEHAGGSFLLRLLEKSNVKNKAIFTVRDYDGSHISKDRFRAMADAVKSVFIKSPYNRIIHEHQFIWGGELRDLFKYPPVKRGKGEWPAMQGEQNEEI